MKNKEIAEKLWQEYLRVEDWAKTSDEIHIAKSAIRCCATRLGCYVEFCECDE